MLNISVEKINGSIVGITPASIKRDWMDATSDRHAYRCFPVTQANMIGWNLFLEKDLKFIWNGINDTSSNNVTVTEGSEFCHTGRGQSTVSLNTGLIFRTDVNVSMLTINPVNYFNDDFETMSSLISTSFYDKDYPLAIKAKRSNEEVVIKSGTPIATIIPISLTSLDNTSIEMYDYVDLGNVRREKNASYGEASQQMNMKGEWTDWYRNAVDENNQPLGTHEVKALKLSVKDNRSK
jgi:hypothetical protein